MKVLHVLSSNKFFGAENVACQIIKMFEGSGVEMAYCSPEGEIADALRERNVNFLPVKKLDICGLKRVISNYSPDIIHAHDMKASLFVSLAKAGKPYISHIHNNAYASRKISLKSVAYAYAAIKAKHIFWVSPSAMKGYRFQSVIKNKSTVLLNAIDADAVKRKAEQDSNSYDYDVIYLGRLTYQKDPLRLIDVLSSAVGTAPQLKAAIVGKGELENEVKNYAESLGLEKNIDFLGYRENPYKILQSSKALLMTSRWEGLPMCALEAISLGVPVIGTPADGLTDIICDGVNGFLSDDNATLARKVCDVICDDGLHCKLSEGARRISDEINDTDKYKNALLDVYKSSLL